MTVATKSVRLALIAAGLMTLAACAGSARSGGAPGVAMWGGIPGAAAIAAGRSDPAPIVSGTLRAYQIRGRWYRPEADPDYDETGMASWYGDAFNGRPTATGEIFDMYALSAAHKTLPLPALVEVTNLANGRKVVLRVNDRGPFVDGRIIDLSRGAASELGLLNAGVGEVRVRYVGPAPRLGGGRQLERAEARPQAPTPSRAVPQQSDSREAWVQAGSFSDPLSAGRVADQLGDKASVAPAVVGGRDVFRVIVGPWDGPNAAESARHAVIARGYPDAIVVMNP